MMSLRKVILRVLAWRLFARPAAELGWFEIVKWWEFRRVFFNLLVGGVGLVTLLAVLLIDALAGRVFNNVGEMPAPFIAVFVVAYGIGANVCYTGGWTTELFVRWVWKERAGAIGEVSFFLGCVFSVLVTLAPIALTALAFLMRLLFPGFD